MAKLTLTGSGNLTSLLISSADDVADDVNSFVSDAFSDLRLDLFENVSDFESDEDVDDTFIANTTRKAYRWLLNEIEEYPGVTSSGIDIENITSAAVETAYEFIVEGIIGPNNPIQWVNNNTQGIFDSIMSVLNTSSLISEFDDIGSHLKEKVSEVVVAIKNGVDAGFAIKEKDFHPSLWVDKLEFNMSTSPPLLPDASLQFELDGMELYLELDTLIEPGGTYAIPLFRADTAIGPELGQYGTAHVSFGVDLIVYANTDVYEAFMTTPGGVYNGTFQELKNTHGFHLKLDDVMSVELEDLFSTNISTLSLWV